MINRLLYKKVLLCLPWQHTPIPHLWVTGNPSNQQKQLHCTKLYQLSVAYRDLSYHQMENSRPSASQKWSYRSKVISYLLILNALTVTLYWSSFSSRPASFTVLMMNVPAGISIHSMTGFRHIKQYFTCLLSKNHNDNDFCIKLKPGFGGNNFNQGSLFTVQILFRLVCTGIEVIFRLAEGFKWDLRDLLCHAKYQQKD